MLIHQRLKGGFFGVDRRFERAGRELKFVVGGFGGLGDPPVAFRLGGHDLQLSRSPGPQSFDELFAGDRRPLRCIEFRHCHTSI